MDPEESLGQRVVEELLGTQVSQVFMDSGVNLDQQVNLGRRDAQEILAVKGHLVLKVIKDWLDFRDLMVVLEILDVQDHRVPEVMMGGLVQLV